MLRPLPIVLLLLALALPAATAAPEFPPLTGRVVDRAGLLSERDEAEIEAALGRFEQTSGNQLVVATLPSLQGLTIEEFGYQLGRHWGIGQAGEDNGALLIVAPEERAVRIEVGYGLEGELTDALSRTIIEHRILPRFRDGAFAAGIKAGVAGMIGALGGTYDPALPPADAGGRPAAPYPWPLFLATLIVLIFMTNRIFRAPRPGRRGRRRRGSLVYLPGGHQGDGRRGLGGGGGFSGGGGGFGGGGASGRW